MLFFSHGNYNVATVYPAENCAEFDVRLVYRDRGNATGNLEICFNNTWQSVCIQAVNPLSTASVACRALGFTDFEGTEQVPSILPPVMVQAGPIFRDELFCIGNEQNLSECDRVGGLDPSFCVHEDDLRVQCLGK